MVRVVKNMYDFIQRLLRKHGDGTRDTFGTWGEEQAADFLKRQGYRIIERNYQCKAGEVDIVAADGDFFVFVEVKSRSSTRFGEPEEAVGKEKMHHMKRVANFYMRKHRIQPDAVKFRFDIVSIIADFKQKRVERIRLFKGSEG